MNDRTSIDTRIEAVASPMFSIVITPCDRADLLRTTLTTLTAQSFTDFEIVVLDVSHGNEIAELIKSFNFDNIRHTKPLQTASTSEKWEHGLALTHGRYVTFLDAGSALLLDTCRCVEIIIENTGTDILSWSPHLYWWPDAIPKEYRNHLIVKYGNYDDIVCQIKSISILSYFYKLKISSQDLPVISHSFVSRRVIDKVKLAAGRYFGGISPDIYSGIANCWATENITHVQYSFSVSGMSSNSVMAAFKYPDLCGEQIRAQYRQDNPLEAIRENHPLIGTVRGGSEILQRIPAMAFARDDLFPDDFRIRLNVMGLVDALLETAVSSLSLYDEHIAAACEIARCNGFPMDNAAIPPRPQAQTECPAMRTGPIFSDGGELELLNIDGQQAGITDIFSAVCFVHACTRPLGPSPQQGGIGPSSN